MSWRSTSRRLIFQSSRCGFAAVLEIRHVSNISLRGQGSHFAICTSWNSFSNIFLYSVNPQISNQITITSSIPNHFVCCVHTAVLQAGFYVKIYDVPMKFASKLIHGGQCTIAIDLCIDLWMFPEAECRKTVFDLMTLTFDLWPWFSRSTQTSSRSTPVPNVMTLGPLVLLLGH